MSPSPGRGLALPGRLARRAPGQLQVCRSRQQSQQNDDNNDKKKKKRNSIQNNANKQHINNKHNTT